MASILVCTDGSLYARSIYSLARWAGERADERLHVLHVIERFEISGKPDLSGNIGFDASAELLQELTGLDESHARVARLRGKAVLDDAIRQIGLPPIETTQRHGSLVETLEDFEDDASLVIIGKRGEHADFAKGHLGSNLERVIRSSGVPVLVAAREFRPVNKFLIAFDGGPSSLKAVEHAATRPLLRDLECHLLSVGKPETQLARAQQQAAELLRNAGYRVETDILPGDADEVISAEVFARGVDLLVMGAYGHSRIREFILGSTTTSLIRTCHVPVLLFR